MFTSGNRPPRDARGNPIFELATVKFPGRPESYVVMKATERQLVIKPLTGEPDERRVLPARVEVLKP